MGLSPRGRGNPIYGCAPPGRKGSIPAWAGQPVCASTYGSRLPVYPRVGGATPAGASRVHPCIGLSPRGRGNPGSRPSPVVLSRSIPAWAGQPAVAVSVAAVMAVYPRVGGATAPCPPCATQSSGLSPRGRGNPTALPKPSPGNPVYPRVGGATRSLSLNPWQHTGLSPRGRGNPPRSSWPCAVRRSIPAWAGQPGVGGAVRQETPVYPRVGGATVHEMVHAWQVSGLSPRGRGNPDSRQ